MTLRAKILGLLLGALLCATASCVFTEVGKGVRDDDDRIRPIPGITANVDGPDQVLKALGAPSSRASGWWKDEHQFDIEFRVWYYKGVGRVIFRPEMTTVYATEADKDQGGLQN
jgi:hypothetical protein